MCMKFVHYVIFVCPRFADDLTVIIIMKLFISDPEQVRVTFFNHTYIKDTKNFFYNL